MKVRELRNAEGRVISWVHNCACGRAHTLDAAPLGGTSLPHWSLVGEPDTGRFHPSVRTGAGCHYRLEGGAQHFEDDSATRPGESVDLAELEA